MQVAHFGRALKLALSVSSLALVVGVALFCAGKWHSVHGFVLATDINSDQLFGDFHDVYYPMARLVFATKAPVGGFFYAPAFAVFLGLCCNIARYDVALTIWGIFQVAWNLALVCIPLVGFFRERSLRIVYVALFLVSAPVYHNLKWGQVSVLQTVLIVACLWLYERGHRAAAAICLGLSLPIKFYGAIFIVVFLLKRDWRFLVICAATAAAVLVGVPAVALGPKAALTFVLVTTAQLREAMSVWIPFDINSQYFPHVVRREIGPSMTDAGLEIARVIGWLVVVCNIVAAGVLHRRNQPHALRWMFALCFASVPFWVPTSWCHYFVWLPLIQALHLESLLSDSLTPVRRAAQLLLLWLPSVVLSNIAFASAGYWAVYSYEGCIFFSICFLLASIYILYVFPQLTRSAGTTSGR